MVGSFRVTIQQQDEPIENTEIAHAHEQEVFQNAVGLDTAVDVLADVVEGFEIEVAGFQFRLNTFGFGVTGTTFCELAVACFILSNHPLYRLL